MVNKKKSLNKRYQLSYENKESGAPSKPGVMDWRKVEGGVSFFNPSDGKNRINIIPYTIKTKNHPLVKRGDFEVGDQDYLMDIYTHRNVGASESTVICLKSTFGKPCPICEQSALLRKQGKEKESNELKPSRRVFYNIQDMKEPDKLKVFETSHYLFEKELIDEARDDEEGGFIDFADPVDGKEIRFRTSEVQKGSMKYKEFKSFGFDDREEPIPDELLESAISFDEIMNIPTYEEVEKILFGKDDDEDSNESENESKEIDEDRPAKKSSKKNDEDDDELEEKPSKKPAKNREEDDGEEFETPKKPMKEVEEDNESEPPKKSCGDCPFGHNFGKDVDKFNDCDDCDKWDKCMNCK